MGWANAGHSRGRPLVISIYCSWIVVLVALAGCFLIGCKSKTPAQRYSDRLNRLTEKMESLQEQIQEEQKKEIDRLRDAHVDPRARQA